MKAVPILIITNALALGLVLMLWLQQSDLESQLKNRRAPASNRTSVAVDQATQDRLTRLEALLAATGVDVPPPPAEEMPARDMIDTDGAEPTATIGDEAKAEADAAGTLPKAAMEAFRKNVREALRLNGEEDRVKRVVDSIDRLIEDNRIAPMTAAQKEKVASSIMKYRSAMPDIWRKMRTEVPEGTSREDRRKYMMEAFEDLRAEVQTDLEGIVPAADAKVIVDSSRGGMGRGPRGPGSRGDR